MTASNFAFDLKSKMREKRPILGTIVTKKKERARERERERERERITIKSNPINKMHNGIKKMPIGCDGVGRLRTVISGKTYLTK